MAMSRKHYVTVARILKREREIAVSMDAPASVDLSLDSITVELADMFKQDNASFDRSRFYDAAGLTR